MASSMVSTRACGAPACSLRRLGQENTQRTKDHHQADQLHRLSPIYGHYILESRRDNWTASQPFRNNSRSSILAPCSSSTANGADLSAAYKALQAYKTKLAGEFGPALQAVEQTRLERELNEWRKKRRIFFALLTLAPLSVVALCLAAFYFRELACVIVYWALLVGFILVTLAVAGRQVIREMVNGRPAAAAEGEKLPDLEQRWWEQLSSGTLAGPSAKWKGS